MVDRNNPFKPIYDVCNTGNPVEKLESLPSFPRYMDIELTNTCNFKCLMCPTGTGSSKRSKGMLSEEVFEKLLAEITPHKTALRFIRWGEPMLHKSLISFIERSHNAGVMVHINTNGSLMDEAMMTKLLESGLDSIKFSFQGVDRKSYHEMRNIDFFEQLLLTIEKFHGMRGERKIPFIHISTSITYETKEQVHQFQERTKGIADLVTVGRTILDYMDPSQSTRLSDVERYRLQTLKEQESVVKKHMECPEVFDKLSLNWDGTVSACCNDYDNKMIIGDFRKDSLQTIWNSMQMNRYRGILSKMEHHKLFLCKSCYDNYGIQTPGLQATE